MVDLSRMHSKAMILAPLQPVCRDAIWIRWSVTGDDESCSTAYKYLEPAFQYLSITIKKEFWNVLASKMRDVSGTTNTPPPPGKIH
jgi:hypothetical protein